MQSCIVTYLKCSYTRSCLTLSTQLTRCESLWVFVCESLDQLWMPFSGGLSSNVLLWPWIVFSLWDKSHLYFCFHPVYLQWHFSPFHCLLTWEILLYLLIKTILLKNKLHILNTFLFFHLLFISFFISSLSLSPVSFILDLLLLLKNVVL